jgi:hypothetical protein
MGGFGSGSFPDDGSTHRGGRKKRAAVAVAGSGKPDRPKLPKEVGLCWDRIAETVEGIAFAQDSEAITEAAWLLWRQQEFRKALKKTPLDEELNRLSLAVGRSLSALFSQFGLTPRSRQILLVPREEEEKDEFEKMMDGVEA